MIKYKFENLQTKFLASISYYAAVVVQDFYMSGGMASVGLGATASLGAQGGNR